MDVPFRTSFNFQQPHHLFHVLSLLISDLLIFPLVCTYEGWRIKKSYYSIELNIEQLDISESLWSHNQKDKLMTKLHEDYGHTQDQELRSQGRNTGLTYTILPSYKHFVAWISNEDSYSDIDSLVLEKIVGHYMLHAKKVWKS